MCATLLLFYLTTLEKSPFLLSAATYLAEREGFEPSDRVSPVADLAGRWFKPLTHLSISLLIKQRRPIMATAHSRPFIATGGCHTRRLLRPSPDLHSRRGLACRVYEVFRRSRSQVKNYTRPSLPRPCFLCVGTHALFLLVTSRRAGVCTSFSLSPS